MGFLQVSKCPVFVNYKHSKVLNKWFIVIGIRTYKHFLYIFKKTSMKNFNELDIENKLKNSIKYSNFITPTPIQSQAIPIALEGKDVLGTAQTGTGKTLAFTIPLINKLIINKNAMALIICPTRELASQVMGTISKLTLGDIRIGMLF